MDTCSVLVLGDPAGGKSCLINRFLTGQYVPSQLHSVSQTTTHQKLHYVGDTRIRFLIRELSEPTEEALKETDVTVLCFSLETLVSLAQANTYQQAQAVASQIGALAYIETSAKLSYT